MPKVRKTKPEAEEKKLPPRKSRNQSPKYTKAEILKLSKSIKKQAKKSSNQKKSASYRKTASPGKTSTPMPRNILGKSKILVTPIPKSKSRIQQEKKLSQEFDILRKTLSPQKPEPPIWFQSFQQEFKNYKTNVERKLEFLIKEVIELKQMVERDGFEANDTYPDETVPDELFLS